MKVSVIVPVYKTEQYLSACVDSLLRQTYKDIQILLIDDGSPDKSGEICDGKAKKDPRVVCIHKQNGGLSSARNCGIEAATGEYLAFVDSDDVVHADMISVLVKNLERNGADLSGMAYRNFSGECPTEAQEKKCRVICGRDRVERYLLKENRLYCVVRYLYKRDTLGSQRFDERIRLGEDQDFIFRYAQKCSVLAMSDYDGYFYRQNMQSMSNGGLRSSHTFDLENRKAIIGKAQACNRGYAQTHYLKGVMAFAVRGIIYGEEENSGYVASYRKAVRKNFWKILFGKGMPFSYKAIALLLCLPEKSAYKSVRVLAKGRL